MPKPLLQAFLAAALAALIPILLLAGCGATSDSITHIEGSSQRFSKPMLDHWMRAVVANDFRTSIGTKAPRGLVSEPADYAECAEAAKKVVPRTYTGKLKLTDAEISRKCHELYRAIKAQAMGYVLSVQWVILQARQQGLHLSAAELHREFLRFRKEAFGSPARYLKYLHERGMVLSDTLYQLRRNVFVTWLLPKFKERVKRAGGGLKTYARLAFARYHGLIAKTSCKAGYVMEDCKEYRAPATPAPSPDAIIEGFVGAIRKT
jgi:hypothetical protein